MRMRLFFLTTLALAGIVQATDTEATAQGEPMAWRYGLLHAAQEFFDEQAPKRAPGAAMQFRLPGMEPEQAASRAENRAELVGADERIPLPMTSATSFALPRDVDAKAGDQVTIVNRYFPKGNFNHPNVQVRSPGLPTGVIRVGDLRLACGAQMAMAKTEGFKVRAVFATAGLFGLNICDDLDMAQVEAPATPYDTIVIEDGERKLVQPKAGGKLPRLGDRTWSDNARISYLANDRVVH